MGIEAASLQKTQHTNQSGKAINPAQSPKTTGRIRFSISSPSPHSKQTPNIPFEPSTETPFLVPLISHLDILREFADGQSNQDIVKNIDQAEYWLHEHDSMKESLNERNHRCHQNLETLRSELEYNTALIDILVDHNENVNNKIEVLE
eukprot:Filipodium_phascolosomae@DN2827_c0_g1_i1.p1